MSAAYKVSYAQNREDVILEAFFKDVKKGFYVDVGANDPIDDSVTYLFYKNGWTGINIEPNKNLHKKLELHRPKDINLMVGVSNKKGTLVLRQYTNHGLSTVVDDIKSEYDKQKQNEKTNQYEDVKVEVDTLEQLLDINASDKKIQFLKIDVEGFEYEVLDSLSWKKHRPEMLCIEANHIVRDWRPLLEVANYNLVFNDGLNNYYLSKESMFRLKQFDYANSILLDKIVISPGIEKIINENETLKLNLVGLKAQIDDYKLQFENVVKQRNDLFFEIEKYQGFKRQLKMLLVLIYQRLIIRSEAIAFVSQSTYPAVDASQHANTKENLLIKLHNYDKLAFSEKRVLGPKWRRALSRSLIIMLKVPKIMLKKMYVLFTSRKASKS